eukprot:CAMPEP_0183831922 /NCGR_PEP_ID=MMETSP0807_2-20130328/5068_1 /TAXON_ID=88271 /ORGANISM="Picocystis salinarum, Strain CCMP1897" /LENGTH=133 /DNA_ID=CAMNT_0026077539 /DNA_START=1093 /DNA_END=1491 /DNA_ORIENTATION=-
MTNPPINDMYHAFGSINQLTRAINPPSTVPKNLRMLLTVASPMSGIVMNNKVMPAQRREALHCCPHVDPSRKDVLPDQSSSSPMAMPRYNPCTTFHVLVKDSTRAFLQRWQYPITLTPRSTSAGLRLRQFLGW